jgi:F-type H+-transporting ATPase subunit gamma
VHREGVKDVGLIVVTSDKGLCGGLNTNALRLALVKLKEFQGEGRDVLVTALGNKGFGFLQRFKTRTSCRTSPAWATFRTWIASSGPLKVQIDAYSEGASARSTSSTRAS